MGKSKWDQIISEIFSKKNTFLPGDELCALLCESHNISRDYARQIIKRSVNKKLIKSSRPLKFKHGQYIYMSSANRLTFSTLIHITKKYKPSMYRILNLLDKEDGVISLFEARKISATPVDNIERYKLIRLDEEVKMLISKDIISRYIDKEKDITYLITKDIENDPNMSNKINNHFNKMHLDSSFVPDIIRWLKEHNLIDNNKVIYRRSDNPTIGAKHNDFLWDAYAYTKTTGFSINKNDNKQTLVVLDVLIHREYSKEDLDSFYNRLQSVRNSTRKNNTRKVLPIIFFVDADLEVKKEIKRLHILQFSLKTIFGKRIDHLIEKLERIRKVLYKPITSNNASKSVISDIGQSLNVLNEIGHIDNLQNLKGDLFESLMYVVVSHLFPHNARFEHSKIIKPYEYDIVVQQHQEIIIFELKGFKRTTIINLGKKNNEKNTVKWFFGKTLPHAKKAYTVPTTPFNIDKSNVKACYITSANFSIDAKKWLEDANKSKLKPNKIDCFYDGEKLLNLIKNHENLSSLRQTTNFIELLEKYYLTETKE